MYLDSVSVGYLLVFGASGALIREILCDNSLRLPRIKNGRLFLGFIGAVIVGAAVGVIVDHSAVTAFCAGYTGFSALSKLITTKIEPSA